MTRTGGVVPFTVDCPYTLLMPPGVAAPPLVVALHGMGQTEDHMRRFMAPLLQRPWAWLFPRGPYPYEIRKPERTRIGHAWYLFTGDQQALRESMDLGAAHLGRVLDAAGEFSRVALAGFSQGGYLAAYAGPMLAPRVAAAACLGGRIKHEFLAGVSAQVKAGFALAQFHGGRDENVAPALAREAVEKTRALGFARVHYGQDPECSHEISAALAGQLGEWLEEVLR
ncbi:MAG: hypothetical protein IT463_00420 [Planctomycetes bacterium]|nr:hypothetical protein [Planctomycetota bacterium]